MSLNCLTCQALPRSDSETDNDSESNFLRRVCCAKVERRWSGNLSPMMYEKILSESSLSVKSITKARKKGHRRLYSSGVVAYNVNDTTKEARKGHRRLYSTGVVAYEGSGEPRLVRSCGMRRDWSFENLRERDEKRDRK